MLACCNTCITHYTLGFRVALGVFYMSFCALVYPSHFVCEVKSIVLEMHIFRPREMFTTRITAKVSRKEFGHKQLFSQFLLPSLHPSYAQTLNLGPNYTWRALWLKLYPIGHKSNNMGQKPCRKILRQGSYPRWT